MTTDEILCRWAELRWGLSDVHAVRFEHHEGFAGSDVTPSEPEEHYVVVSLGEPGDTRVFDDVRLTTDLVNEILTAARGEIIRGL